MVVLVFVVVAVASCASGRAIRAGVRAGAGVPAYERQIPAWLASLDRVSSVELIPRSGVRVVAFVDDRPTGPDLDAFRAVVRARQRVGLTIEWREVVVPRSGACDANQAPDVCDPTLAVLLLTKAEDRRQAKLLRAALASGAESPVTAAQKYLREVNLADELIGASDSLRFELHRNHEIATTLGLHDTPAIFVNGMRLTGPTPDLFDGMLGYLLKSAESDGVPRR
jgi:hypothetical protein